MIASEDKTAGARAGVAAYARALSTPADEIEDSLIRETAGLGGPAMMLSTPDQVRLLAMLVSLMGARRVLELGTFTGRSALAIARAMPANGRLLTCDLSPRWTAIAREHWQRAGIADRIELRLQPAMSLLAELDPGEWLDLVFIDADKGSYVSYYEQVVPRLRPGGVVVADNVLAGGEVVGELAPGSVAAAMDRFNRRVAADDRVEVVVLTVADGLSVIRKHAGDH